ncbi:hypothetical protein P43SY_006953 [Pythium insidiosum]|uniref:Kinesin-like protein n=1 Tax=Pythium insidiosum TaxID=114742 RepID=A0AAD5M264_PYTIN|nr:hypothetical protein P43SY_006953 [Pythium insidiosum]
MRHKAAAAARRRRSCSSRRSSSSSSGSGSSSLVQSEQEQEKEEEEGGRAGERRGAGAGARPPSGGVRGRGRGRLPTSPRTKRQSIAQLRDLVQRQRQRQKQAHDAKEEEEEEPGESDVLLAALLERRLERHCQSEPAADRRIIQVAVRCRPRRARTRARRRRESLLFSPGDSSDDDADDGDDDDDNDDCDAPPSDSVVAFSLPQTAGARPAVSVPPHAMALGSAPRRRFEFDFVFPPWRRQRDVYDACVQPQIAQVLAAAQRAGDAHMTVVAYGQTGTGKTYTMGMLPADAEADEGLIPRALAQILAGVEASGARIVARMSFLQIYLETIEDLLAAGRPTPLQVRLDVAANVFYVHGLREVELRSVDAARRVLAAASRHRVLAATARNKTSSRSHTLLTISLRRRDGDGDGDGDGSEDCDRDGDDAPRQSASQRHTPAAASVSFVDLAGSERVDGALHFLHTARRRQELRIREAKFINRSLSALGAVISSLAAQSHPHHQQQQQQQRPRASPSPSPRASPRSRHRGRHQLLHAPKAPAHIRFRDSQLTKLLQSRLLHGRGRLLLIATIDDRPQHLTETLSTLKFAAQCRRVELGAASTRAAETRKRREETLLKQVFADVKVMYEEREAALRQRYDARLAELEARAAPPMRQAPYVALCSLVDQLRRPHPTRHPALDEFEDDAAVAQYVATLYQELKAAIALAPTAQTPAPRRRRTVSGGRSRERLLGERDRVKTAPAPMPAPMPAPENEAETATNANANATTATADAFEAIARCLFQSRALDEISVSSEEEKEEDDDGRAAFSQLATHEVKRQMQVE